MSPVKESCEEPMLSEFCPRTMDKLFQCDTLGHADDEPENDTIDIDDEKLAQIRTLLDQEEDSHGWSSQVFNILSDKVLPSESFSALEEFRKIMIKYPCHVCHKDILKALLRVVNKNYLNELHRDFVKQVLNNTNLNINKLSTEILWLSSEIFEKYMHDIVTQKIVDKYILWDIFEALIARYGPEYKMFQNCNSNLQKVLISALKALERITAVYHNYHPDDAKVHMGLTKAFEADADLVTAIANNIIQFTDVTDMIGRFEAWSFYDSFTKQLYEERALKNSSFDKVKYIRTISVLNKSLLKTFPDLDVTGEYPRYRQNIKTMFECASELDHFPTGDLYDTLIQGALNVPELLDDLFEFFYKKTLEISKQMDKLDHLVDTGELHYRKIEHEFKYKHKSAPEVTQLETIEDQEKNTEWIDKIWETIEMFCRKNAVKKFDLRFLQALINVAYYNKRLSCLVELTRLILQRKLTSKLEVLDTSIAKAIMDVINRFHNNCAVCVKGFDILEQLLDLLVPTVEECSQLKNHLTIQQAVSITYVLRIKNTLFEVMYPKGFKKLTEQLRYGESVESLFMVSQTFNALPPSVLGTHLQSVPCKNCLNDPVEGSVGTKVFVLDDGKKIRSSTAHLAKYSEFFSSLLDGRFHEAELEEIHIGDVTEFQFHFLVNFIHFEVLKQKIVFKMGLQEHLDMIILCEKLLLPGLSQQLIDSLRWSCMTADALPDVYELGTVYGIQYLRRMCLDHTLAGGTKAAMKMKMLQILFEKASDREALAMDVHKWITSQYFFSYKPDSLLTAGNHSDNR